MRGLDPYAAPIVGTANTIMQGLGVIEDRKHREEDRAWNRQVQERQQQEWQSQDEFNEIVAQAMQGGVQSADEQPLPNMQQGLGVSPNQTPAPSPGLQQGMSRQSTVQQKQSPDPQEIFSKAPYFTQKKGALSDMDLSKYSPAAIVKAQEYFIDFETKQMRHSEAGLNLLRSQAEEHRRQGLQKVSQALIAYQQGNIEQSVSLLKEAHDMDIPNGRTTTINPDGNVIARNFVTGEQGELGLDVNDPKQIENTIKQMSQYFQSPEQFVNDYFLNSETQLEAKKEALLNPKVMVDNRGTALYRVDIPNSDTGQIDTLFFDHLPTFGSDPLQVDGSQLQGFQEIGTAKDVANILDKRDQTVNRQAKRAGLGAGEEPTTKLVDGKLYERQPDGSWVLARGIEYEETTEPRNVSPSDVKNIHDIAYGHGENPGLFDLLGITDKEIESVILRNAESIYQQNPDVAPMEAIHRAIESLPPTPDKPGILQRYGEMLKASPAGKVVSGLSGMFGGEQQTPQRRIVRRGTDPQGNRVVEYSDGTIERE